MRRPSRRPSLLVLPALAALAAGLLTAAPAAAGTVVWCSDAVSPADLLLPCIESASVDGSPIVKGDPHYGFLIEDFGDGSSRWNLQYDGAFDMPADQLAKTFTVAYNVRAQRSDTVMVSGQQGPIVRTTALDGAHLVTVTSQPVTMIDGCLSGPWPATCKTVADTTYAAVLQGLVAEVDGGSAFRNLWSNLYGTWAPEFDGSAVVVKMSSPHFLADGTTVFVGQSTFDMDYAQIKEQWGIDDPAALVLGGVTGTVQGGATGAVAVTDVPADSVLRIAVSGVTFSSRKAIARAVAVTPRPGKVKAVVRTSARRAAVVSYRAAASRGSRVSGYQVRCVRTSAGKVVESHLVAARVSARSAVVKGLRPARAYGCQVRALSRAGAGAWSARVAVR